MTPPERKDDSGDWKALAIIGGLGLLGLGVGLGGWKLAEWLEEREKIKQALIEEYLLELDDLEQFQAGLVAKGDISDTDNAILDLKAADLARKEWLIESYSTHWLVDLVDSATAFLRGFGIWVILVPIAGYIGYQVLRRLFKNRPPRPRPPQCPKCGLTFPNDAALKEHMEREHPANPDPVEVLSAQAIFAMQPYWVQQTVAVEAGLYGRVHQRWDTLRADQIRVLAYAMALVAIVALAPALGPAAALLII